MAKVSKELRGLIKMFDEYEKINEEEIEELELDSEFIYNLNETSVYITEEREIGKVLHTVESVLLTIIFALLANCNTFVQIHLFMVKHYKWLEEHIKYENGLPSLSTIKRVISFVNTKELENWCNEALKSFIKNNKPIYQSGAFEINDIKTVDGKTANSSDRKSSKEGEVSKTNAMSIFSVKNEICEATEFIEDKTNEIPTCPKLLKRINVKRNIIVFDALNTQKETIEYIVDNEGYYVAPIKGNHKILYEELCDYFNDKEFFNKVAKENYIKNIEKRNGDAEIREYGFTNDIDWLYNKKEWLGLKSVGFAKRTYRNGEGKTVSDIRFYISNLDSSFIDIISTSIRSEWKIENNLHYFLDTVFGEDDSTAFVENAQKNLNILRKFSLKILKIFKEKSKLSMNSIRFNISMDFENEIENIIATLYE